MRVGVPAAGVVLGHGALPDLQELSPRDLREGEAVKRRDIRLLEKRAEKAEKRGQWATAARLYAEASVAWSDRALRLAYAAGALAIVSVVIAFAS